MGLNKSIDLKVESLKVIFAHIKCQIRNTIHYVLPNLKNYQQEVCHLISSFQAFYIKYIPRIHNATIDTLTNAATMLSPHKDGFSIEIIYKPSISNIITNLHMFNDDQMILDFMANVGMFKDEAIDEDVHDKDL